MLIFEEKCVSPVLTMVNYTTMLVLGISWAVFSQSGNNPWPLPGTRVSLRILKRNQNQREGFETSDRFHRVTRNDELLFGRFNRINKRNKTGIPRLLDDELQRLEEKLLTRVMSSGDHSLGKHGVVGYWIF